MTDIRDRLRDADPVPNEPRLPADVVAAMRRRVIDAAREPRGTVVEWKRTLAIAAAVAVIAVAGIDTARRTARHDNPSVPLPSAPAAASTARTQLHFSTPGGTRIIWTIDPTFHMKEGRQ